MSVLGEKSPDAETFFHITAKLDEMSPVPHVGCKEHVLTLTYRIISFYLTVRMFFVATQCNKNNDEHEKKTREKRKDAKLTGPSPALSQEPEVLMKKCIKRKATSTTTEPTKTENEASPKKLAKKSIDRSDIKMQKQGAKEVTAKNLPKNFILQTNIKMPLRDISNFCVWCFYIF